MVVIILTAFRKSFLVFDNILICTQFLTGLLKSILHLTSERKKDLLEAYEWCNAPAGKPRAGWDYGEYEGQLMINCIAHTPVDGDDIEAMFSYSPVKHDKWIAFLQFGDGDGSIYDYLSGCKLVVGHEYQHGITHFSYKDFNRNPGVVYLGWYEAVQEGLSDVFGALFAEQ